MNSHPKQLVMVVEDDPDCLEAMSFALEYDGYEVVGASNGLEALGYLESTPSKPCPSLILLDLMMPEMNGRQFLEERVKRPALAQIPVALLSGERDLADGPNELTTELPNKLGIYGKLQKPIILEDLLSAVHHWTHPVA